MMHSHPFSKGVQICGEPSLGNHRGSDVLAGRGGFGVDGWRDIGSRRCAFGLHSSSGSATRYPWLHGDHPARQEYCHVPLYNRGVAYQANGDLDLAIADFDLAIALNPKYAKAYNNRGNAYKDKGDLDRAIADLDQAVALLPDTPTAVLQPRQRLPRQG